MPAARQIRHVILTRFNLRSSGREAKYRATAGWMDERFDLFEKFTVPSINAQTDQDFVWFVFFDAETEPE
ncbi:MAG: glycosyltransferase, partial [Planctomycetota bacterium]